MPHPRPTGEFRTFGRDEVIVSKTDPKGRITYANDVFLRVAAYTEVEVLGRPHSLVRHPEMPRAVFSLAWEQLLAGREVFAYILNLAGDGASYWVLAHLTPTVDAGGRLVGFHSNRRWPQPTSVARVHELYRDLLATEQRVLTAREQVSVGRRRLDELLEAAGVEYDELVWRLIAEAGEAA